MYSIRISHHEVDKYILTLLKILNSLKAPKKKNMLFLNCSLNGETKNCFEDHLIKHASFVY